MTMNVLKPTRCVFQQLWAQRRLAIRRSICSTAYRNAGRQRIPQSQMSKEDRRALDEEASELKPYTEAERMALAQKHTPEQIAAIEAAEEAVDPRDLISQGHPREDPMRLKYIEDLSAVDPIADNQARPPIGATETKIRWKNNEDIVTNYANQMWKETGGVDQTTSKAELDEKEKYFNNKLLEYGDDDLSYLDATNPSAIKIKDGVLAPELPHVQKPLEIIGTSNDLGEDEGARLIRLQQQSGLTEGEIRKIRVKALVRRRVVNQTRLGKISSQYFLTVAGNQNGMLGIGEGKSAEVVDAKRQATMAAIRNMKPIPRYENRTIFGEVETKVGAVQLKLTSRPPGMRLY